MPTVLLIEDHPAIAAICATYLANSMPELEVMQAENATEGLDCARRSEPAVVLLDLTLPDADGLTLIEPLRARARPPAVLLLTGRLDAAMMLRSIEPGVSGVISKREMIGDHIVPAVRSALAGRRYDSPRYALDLAHFRADPDCFAKKLSPAELQLLPLFGEGLDNDQVASRSGLAANTIKNHRQHIMGKLKLPTSAALVAWTAENGYARRRHF